jgi:hypothetical protein
MTLDYSYLDFRLEAIATKPTSCCSGEDHGVRMHVYINEEFVGTSRTSIEGSGMHWVGIGGASLFNPDVYSLSVKFDLVITKAPDALTPPNETHPRSDAVELFDGWGIYH